MTGIATSPSAPEASQAVIESAVRQALQHVASRERPTGPSGETERLILLRAAPHWRGDPVVIVDSQHGAVGPIAEAGRSLDLNT